MIQEARPWLVDFYAAAVLDSFLVFWVFPWVDPGVFCVFSSSSFSLGCFRCFGVLMSGFGVSLASLGWAAWFLRFFRFFFLVLPTPPLGAGPGAVSFVCLLFLLPSCGPPHSVLGHGLGNRAP